MGSADADETIWNLNDILGPDSDVVKYAILVLNQPIFCDPNLIASLWRKAQVRFTVDGGTNRWLQFIEEHSGEDLPLPDCITGDFDSITNRTKKYFKEKSVKFVETLDQDYTDFAKSLRELKSYTSERSMEIHHVLAIVTNSGRVDHIMGNLETLHTSKNLFSEIPVVMMSSNSLTWLLSSNKKHTIQVPWEFVSQEHAVGLIPLHGPTVVTTSGLKWNLDNTRMAFGELVSTSNTFIDSTVKVKCDLDLVWTVQFSKDEI